MFHIFCTIPTEESRIATAPYLRHTEPIDTSLERETCELFFCLSELLSDMDTLEVEEFLFYEFLLSCLDGKIRLSKGDFLLPRVAILRDEICSIASEVKVCSRSSSSTFYWRQ